MNSPRDVVDRVGGRFPSLDDGFERLARRRDRKRRNQRIGAGALALLIVIVTAGAFARAVMSEGVPAVKPAPGPSPTEEPAPEVRIDWDRVPGVTVDRDVIVDVRTGEVTRLPNSIVSVRKSGAYAVAPGGDVLLFSTRAAGSKSDQIFVANVDGTNVRQVTDAPGGAAEGAWSPDGTKIVALFGGGAGRDIDLVVIDVATGKTTVLASGRAGFDRPHFEPDGRRILFGRFANQGSHTYGIPVDGGNAVLVFEERWNAILSPDGRTIVYDADASAGSTGGLESWLADADGSHPRRLVPNDEPFSFFPSWSPDGTQIVYTKWPHEADPRVAVVDVDSGTPMFSVLTHKRPGVAVWLDDHTLIVDIDAF